MRRFAYLLLLGACGGHYRTEIVGQGALGGSVQLAGAGYDLALDLDSPRAQLVDWSVRCGEAEVAHGQVGEPFEVWRDRRISQLTRERDDEKARAGAVTSLIVGAVAPAARVGNARVGVDPNAAGAVAAASVANDPIVLAPGDVGADHYAVRVRVQAAGACRVIATADDPAVRGQFRITRVHDLDQEAHDAAIVAGDAAVEVRARVHAELIALGADPEHRAKLAAEAEARHRAALQAELEIRIAGERERARVRAIADAELEAKRHALQIVIERQRALAFEIRGRIFGELILYGADASLRARLEDERARRDAEAEALRVRLALDIRGRMRGYLVGIGGIEKPPMPALIVEAHGVAPFDGAVWLAGTWRWSGTAWLWTKGGWSDPGHFGEAGTATIVVATPPPPPVPTVVVVEAPRPPPVVVPTIVVDLPTVHRHVIVKPKKDPGRHDHRK